jgi:polyisoprenoid-binding protein YceI
MTMKTVCNRARWSGLAVAGWLAQTALAQPTLPAHWPAEAIIRFNATSTLHDFGGTVPAQPFGLMIHSNQWSAEADVLAGLMDTASAKRDKSMHEMFNTNDYPRLHGKVTAATIPAAGSTNATLSLKIRDQQHDVPVVISNWSETPSNLTFRAEWDVSLKQFKLKPPSVLGVIRVGDTVHLSAEVTADKTRTLTNATPAPIVPAGK